MSAPLSGNTAWKAEGYGTPPPGLWARFLALFRPAPAPAPEPTVDEHFDQMLADWSDAGAETIRAAAIHLADLRSGRYVAEPVDLPSGLYRVRLHDGQRLHGWQRATVAMADQARAAELPLRPEADFPLREDEPEVETPERDANVKPFRR